MLNFPLNEATKGKELVWSDALQKSFDEAKAAMTDAVLLAHPDANAEWSLPVDASDSHIGGMLQQTKNGVMSLLSFFSKKLQGAELLP